MNDKNRKMKGIVSCNIVAGNKEIQTRIYIYTYLNPKFEPYKQVEIYIFIEITIQLQCNVA